MRTSCRITAPILIALVSGCGTRIGNPGDDEEQASAKVTIANTLVQQLISAVGTGEYLLDAGTQKIISSTQCDSTTSTISRESNAEHSITQELENRVATVELGLVRSIDDAWTGLDFECEQNAIVATTIGAGASMVSRFNETRQRKLSLLNKISGESLAHSSESSSTGELTLAVTRTPGSSYSATVSIDTETSVQAEGGAPVALSLDDSTVAFSATRQADKTISYQLDDGSLAGEFAARPVQLTWQNVSFDQSFGCYPVSGTLSVTFAGDDTYVLDVSKGYENGFVGSAASLLFGPDGCAFREQ